MVRKRRLEILALIPARSGSKAIPNKNIRIIAGKPLLAHSITHALESKLITRVIVSTDSPIYATIAREYGAESPFLRPSKISQDLSTDLEVFSHALKWLAKKEGYVPDICVHLRPTYPIRKVDDIDKAIKILVNNPDLDSVRSVVSSQIIPMKMWFVSGDGLLSPVVVTKIKDAYNLPRQILPKALIQNGCIDVVRTRVIIDMKSMTGTKIFGYVMDNNFDIDTESQLKDVSEYMKNNIDNTLGYNLKRKLNEKKIFCFDVDGIIATIVPVSQYDLAMPQRENIKVINYLYEQGHQIILFTARGTATGIDWTELTRRQLIDWDVKYHKLLFGKPAADYYIDDKMLSIEKIKEYISKQVRNHKR